MSWWCAAAVRLGELSSSGGSGFPGVGCCAARAVEPGTTCAGAGARASARIWLVPPPLRGSRSGQAPAFSGLPPATLRFGVAGACSRLRDGPAYVRVEGEGGGGGPGFMATAIAALFSWHNGGAPLPSPGLRRRPEVTRSSDFEARRCVWFPVKTLQRPRLMPVTHGAFWCRPPPCRRVAKESKSLKSLSLGEGP
ncbi:hypothetical protein VPH35_043826 [Triticum aestivum]